jgi:tetratricopeptide (TPR) repeat protein
MLAQALAAQGRHEDAKRELERAAPLSAKSELHSVRFNVALAAGRVQAAAGRQTEAAKSFRAALEEARRAGIYGATLEARLALAETDLRSARAPAARKAFAALEGRRAPKASSRSPQRPPAPFHRTDPDDLVVAGPAGTARPNRFKTESPVT